MFDSLLHFVLGVASVFTVGTAAPIASAESIQEPVWIEKSAEAEAMAIVKKNDLLQESDATLYWVVAVLDGDTLLVSGSDRQLFQVRLLAVNTKEINGPDSTAECYGYEAAVFTTEFLKNRAITLTADPANTDLDPYGRKLRYVDVLQADGSFLSLNGTLLREGIATFPAQYSVSNPAFFQGLEKEAQSEGKGLWSACR